MELVEGSTLADRIAQGPIPVDEALPIAKQIAEALEAAHEQGIIHRDLKPANIKVRSDGTVKVLDFGLAKAIDPAAATARRTQPPASHAATTHARATRAGVILGTAAYMSPEQARGQTVDKRADVWAFGCVLYEMLTGGQAFGGPTLSDTFAAILGREPDLRALSATTPAGIERLLKRCFEKDPRRRLRDIGEARIECDEAKHPDAVRANSRVATQRKAGLKAYLYTATALLGALIAGGVASAWYFRRAPVEAAEMRLQIATPGGNLTKFALSPDGRKLVFEATVDGRTQLWLRPLESEAAQLLPGTENGRSPFWSPDNRSIAFFADAQLKRIDVAGGPTVTLASAPDNLGATWSRDGAILFVPQNSGPMYRVPAAGGKAVPATQVDPPRITAQWHPFFLPDGRHFLFYALGAQEQRGVYIGALDSNETHRLFDSDAEAVFRSPDLVLHAQQGALVAQRLDLKTWEPVGDPFPVANAVATDFLAGGYAAISSSDAGPIAYRAAGPQRQFVWVDRRGNELETVGPPETARVGTPRPSPDNLTVAFTRATGKYQDVWLMESARGVLQRFTFDAGNKVNPLWAPDGRRIAFAWDRQGVLDLYERPVDGTADPTLLLSAAVSKTAWDWSPDGRFILYSSQESGGDLWALPLTGDKKPVEVARTPFNEPNGRFSPDGHWVAYQSNETGQFEIYVQPFPEGRLKKQITSGGGVTPQWGADGRELL